MRLASTRNTLYVIAAAGGACTALSACGSNSNATTAAATTPRPTTTAARAQKTEGPGTLLAPALVYRDTPDYIASADYVVIFRARGRFAGTDSVGTTNPGRIELLDAVDNHDGYAGALSTGTPKGKCYWWTLQGTPKLDGTPKGKHTTLTLHLPRTTAQRRTVTLRTLPAGATSDSWTTNRQIARDLRRIGCKGRNLSQ
ncbi:hypothetical protein AB0L40_04265 [Patulibacter sp. NPDC049589]|uniref:hypothetical protein n=1 Tax=Patulibacter sp. NPDC049589 TaxID=3154731 RepID=UPI00342F3EAD